MKNFLRAMAVGTLTLLPTACFSPGYGDPSFTCGDNNDCPGGYTCLSDNLCHLVGTSDIDADTTIDSDIPSPDATPGPDTALSPPDAIPLPDALNPPDNDTCPGALPLICGGAVVGSFNDSTNAADYSCSGGNRQDVYYFFTITGNRDVTVALGSAFDTALTLLSDCSSEMQCRNATSGGETISIENLAAGTYFIAAEALNGTGGSFSISCTTAPATVRPTNNTCANPTTLTDGVQLTSQNAINATDNVNTACNGGGNGDVAYTFTIPPGPNRRAQVTVSGAAGFDPTVTLRGGTCPGTELECANFRDDAREVLNAADLAAGTYFVWVDMQGGSPTTFDIRLDLLTAVSTPSNDQCTLPDILTANNTRIGSTIGATDDYDLACLSFDSKDTVHRFTTSSTRAVLVTIDPTTPWALAASLRTTANCTNVSDVSCVAGAFATRYFNQPSLAAGSYDVIIDGVAGDVGDYSISYTTRPADSTFGYWEIRTTKTYQFLTGGISVPVTAGDVDANFPLMIPFSFPFFGNSYTQLVASDNGFVTFGPAPSLADTATWENDCPLDASTPLDIIALFWDDMFANPDGSAKLRHRLDGMAPHRTFTIEYRDWDALENNCGGGGCFAVDMRTTQKLVLHENGDIALHYGPRSAPTTILECQQQHTGCSATIGLRNANGTDTDQAQCDDSTQPVGNGTYIYYVAPR